MMSRWHSSLIITVVLAAATSGLAGELGDAAPELQIAEWVKGQPVALADGKGTTIYVVELWATFCPHSRRCVSLLTEMQKKYQDRNVVFVAVSFEELDTVKTFVNEQGSRMEYRVAVDKDKATAREYLGGFRVAHTNTAWAFLVDKSGNIVWHGHPEYGLADALDALLAGKYDMEARKRVDQARPMLLDYIQAAGSPAKYKSAREIGEKLIELGQSDAWLMNELAWAILDRPGLIRRDLDLAVRVAQLAFEVSDGRHADVLDTYARALFDTGKKKEALEHQKIAVKLAKGLEARAALEKTLAKYQKAVDDD